MRFSLNKKITQNNTSIILKTFPLINSCRGEEEQELTAAKESFFFFMSASVIIAIKCQVQLTCCGSGSFLLSGADPSV